MIIAWILGSILFIGIYIMWLITIGLKDLQKIRKILEKDDDN